MDFHLIAFNICNLPIPDWLPLKIQGTECMLGFKLTVLICARGYTKSAVGVKCSDGISSFERCFSSSFDGIRVRSSRGMSRNLRHGPSTEKSISVL